MRIRLAALALVSLGVAFAAFAPSADAKKDPVASANAKIEKDAEKDAKAITKTVARSIRVKARATAKVIKALTKAAKSGKNVAQLSGVEATSGEAVPHAQLVGLFRAYLDAVAGFHNSALGSIEGGYADVADSAALRRLGASTLNSRFPGTGGAVDLLTRGFSDGWAGGDRTITKSSEKFRTTVAGAGLAFTHVNCVPPKLSPPSLGSVPDRPLSTPTILGTTATSDADIAVLVAGSDVPDPDGSPTQVTIFDTGRGFAFDVADLDPSLSVAYWRQADSTAVVGSYMAGLRSSTTGALRPTPFEPVSVPDAPPVRGGGGGGDLVSTTSASLTADGVAVMNAVVGAVVVETSPDGITLVEITVRNSSDDSVLFTFELFVLGSIPITPGVPVTVQFPHSDGQSPGLFFFPEGPDGQDFFAADEDTLELVFGSDPTDGPADVILTGTVMVTPLGTQDPKIPLRIDIRVDQADVMDMR